MMTQTCRGCGQPLAAAVSFCPNCGVRAETNGAQNVTQPVAAQVPLQQPVQQTAPITPPVMPAPADPAERSRRAKMLAGITALALVAAVAIGFLWPTNASSGELIADGPITAAGGKIPLTGGGEIDVPKDAVSKPERVTVRRTVVRDRVVIPPMQGQPGTTFSPGTLPLLFFGPNITFLRPVTITITVGPRTIAVRIFVIRNGRLQLVRVVPTAGGQTIRITVRGFQNGLLVI